MDFSEFFDKAIQLANTPGGFVAALLVTLPLALYIIGRYSKIMAEARKLDAETKKIRAQGDAETDLADSKNTAKILDIMQQTVTGDAEKTRMIQAVIEKGREENEQNRKTLDKVSEALKEFNIENKAWRFDFKTNTHMVDGSLLALASKVEGMAGDLQSVKTESHENHAWLHETLADVHEKVTTIHAQVGFMHKLVSEAARKPDPTPPATDAPKPENVTPLNADAAASKATVASELPKAG